MPLANVTRGYDIMVAEGTTTVGEITQEEIEAAKAAIQNDPNFSQEDLMRKNSAVLTVMMPLPLRIMIDEAAATAAKQSDPNAEKGSAADWVRDLLARELNYTLPTKGATRVKKDKRSIEVQQRAQRAMVAELIKKAREGGIDLG